MKTHLVYIFICCLTITPPLVGCSPKSTSNEPIAESIVTSTIVHTPTATPKPATQTAVPTSVPIPTSTATAVSPTATPLPTPTPTSFDQVVDEPQDMSFEIMEVPINVSLYEEEVIPLPGDMITFYQSGDGPGIDYPMSVLIDAQDTVWFGSSDGVASFDNSNGWRTYPSPVEYLGLVTVTQNQDQEIFASGCGGVFKLVGDHWESLFSDVPISWCATRIAAAGDGSIWINQFDIPQDRGYGAVYLDANQSIWFGGYASSIDHPDTILPAPWAWDEGYITSIIPRENGETWFGTTTGVFVLADEKWSFVFDEAYGEYSWITTATVGPEGDVWFGTPVGFARFDGKEWTNYQSTALTTYDIFALAFDSNGVLWVSTLTGIGRFENDTLTFYEYGEGDPFASITNPMLIGMSIVGILDSMVIDPSGDIWMPAGPLGIMKVSNPSLLKAD